MNDYMKKKIRTSIFLLIGVSWVLFSGDIFKTFLLKYVEGDVEMLIKILRVLLSVAMVGEVLEKIFSFLKGEYIFLAALGANINKMVKYFLKYNKSYIVLCISIMSVLVWQDNKAFYIMFVIKILVFWIFMFLLIFYLIRVKNLMKIVGCISLGALLAFLIYTFSRLYSYGLGQNAFEKVVSEGYHILDFFFVYNVPAFVLMAIGVSALIVKNSKCEKDIIVIEEANRKKDKKYKYKGNILLRNIKREFRMLFQEKNFLAYETMLFIFLIPFVFLINEILLTTVIYFIYLILAVCLWGSSLFRIEVMKREIYKCGIESYTMYIGKKMLSLLLFLFPVMLLYQIKIISIYNNINMAGLIFLLSLVAIVYLLVFFGACFTYIDVKEAFWESIMQIIVIIFLFIPIVNISIAVICWKVGKRGWNQKCLK